MSMMPGGEGYEKLLHMAKCNAGKHEARSILFSFTANYHTYQDAECKWCKQRYWTKDGQSISREEFEAGKKNWKQGK